MWSPPITRKIINNTQADVLKSGYEERSLAPL
jgi:hypothetical protein